MCGLSLTPFQWKTLNSLPPRTIRNILSGLQTVFQDCCCIPLRKIEENPSSDLGWKLLLLLPRMLLQPHTRGGKVGQLEVKARYQRFLNFHWKELLHLQMTATTSIKNHLSMMIGREKWQLDSLNVGKFLEQLKCLLVRDHHW